MFAVTRIVRSKVSLKNHLYTSCIIRCDKPNSESDEKPKLNGKKPIKGSKHKVVKNGTSKKELTAALNAEDYANFKSHRLSKLELYSDKRSAEEKLEAKKELEALTEEVKNKKNVSTPTNEKLKTLAVKKPKKKPKANLNDTLVESAKAVAVELGGDTKKTQGDIMEYLKTMNVTLGKKTFNEDDEDIRSKENQMHEHFKAGRGKHFRENKQEFFRNRWKHSEDSLEQQTEHFDHKSEDYGYQREKQNEPKIRNIISGQKMSGVQPLGLFKETDFKDDGPKLKTWDELEELELQFAATVPPRNYFEELIQWTKEGKLWHFPIDNDQGNELEANIDFSEHVFLEQHLEPWCPKRGPLRHFMELVLTGLGKNHHLTVEEKKEHIHWYRDYFEGKKKLLKDMGALDNTLLQESAELNSKLENPA